ncbi:MAG: ligand-binding protein SH3 [Candidatus Omnitrophica bacterium CG11_big_fil_rev_8_21_14_0_20_64_10]|nr:MAG: ligand-binding protein SH3 [Candidatus Omnitrophica bacterium CG11_big_fil_rev_8_21_14_0_20_64_10]
MIERLVEFFGALPPEWIICLIAALPVSELRGAIPAGVILLDLPLWEVLLLSYLGNLLPVVPLLLFLRPVSRWLHRFSVWHWFFYWLFARTRRRAKIVERYKGLGLALFVAVPLPVTGAWTGCAAAMLFRFRFWPAFLAIASGVGISGLIVAGMVHAGLSLL